MWFGTSGGGGNSSNQRQHQHQQLQPEMQQWSAQSQAATGHRGRSSSSSNGSPAIGSQLDQASCSQAQQYHSTSQQSVIGQPQTPALSATAAAGATSNQQTLQQQQSHHSGHSSSSHGYGSHHSSNHQERISFHLKTSIFTRRVTLETDKMALGLIKQLAIAFLNDIYFQHQYPANTYIGDYIRKHLSTIDNQQALYERLVLRKYNCQKESFVPFNSVSDIEPESHISIEVSEKAHHLLPGGCSVSVSPAASSTGLHLSPTSVSSTTTTSLQQQQASSLSPQSASANASSSPSSSTSAIGQQSAGGQLTPSIFTTTPTNHSSSTVSLSSNSSSSNAGFHQQSSAGQLKIAHDFNIESFLRPTFCAMCNSIIMGFRRQGFQCSFCKKNFCKECKAKAESSGDVCLAPPSPSLHHHHHQQQQQQNLSAAGNTESGASNGNGDPTTSAATASRSSNHVHLIDLPNSQTSSSSNTSGKLDLAHSNMSKRKSASNLLHFTIANPFKSHHASSAANNNSSSSSQQQQAAAGSGSNQQAGSYQLHQQVGKTKSRGSAGALDPVLQQLSKMREQQQLQQQPLEPSKVGQPANSQQQQTNKESAAGGGGGNLTVMAHTAHLSSSHQNLFTSGARSEAQSFSQEDHDQATLVDGGSGGGAAAGSSSAHQSPIGSRHHASQLSNSARTSASDLHASSSSSSQAAAAAAAAAIPKPRDHSFICMDWIQVKSSALCQVCNKSLRSSSLVRQQQQQFESKQQQTKLLTPFMCKSCQLQVHGHCQRLAPADCMNRIAESSRAAAEQSKDSTTGQSTGNNGAAGRKDNSADDNTPTQHRSAGEDKAGLRGVNSNVSRDNIPLHRLQTSVRHVKPPSSTKPLIEGWLRHTLADGQARQHYWRLDEQEITLYDSDTTTRYFKAIGVNKITRVMSATSLPKCVKEDVVLMTARAMFAATNNSGNSNSAQQESSAFGFVNSDAGDAKHSPTKKAQPVADNNNASATTTQTRSPNSSPAKSPGLRDQMNAMFGFELATGLVFLVQAGSELEAARWQETLASVMARQRPPSDQPSSGLDSQQQSGGSSSGAASTTTTVATTSPPGQSSVVDAKEQLQQAELGAPAATTAKPTANEEGVPCAHGEKTQTAAGSTKQLLATETTLTGTGSSSSTADILPIDATEPAPRQPAVQRQQQRNRYPPVQRYHRGQHKTHIDPNRSRLYNRPRITIELDPMSIPDHMIERKYLVERDRVKKVGFQELGSGQFGKVYAAISEWKREEDPNKSLWSGVPVAIKEISKARFDLRQQAKLKNEANILSHLDHPGVIILERVHDLPDKIYIVMEQLEDDMLEMIVSSKEKRLDERVTKFLTYQIIEALIYLHSQNIAHCDLKPENVLLVERRSQFPQIKLCDFGFAKIIEENSFRCSLVGTPAYLAPEVVKGERYNRSVDLWSVGVIVYVSLSGEFPFNEGENIHDQISRANFMYPDKPWAQISKEAKSFINSLLRVNCERRLQASQARFDNWLQDYQLWCDLTELEVKVGKRWLTDDAHYKHWSSYAAEHNLQVPRSAIQLQEMDSNAD